MIREDVCRIVQAIDLGQVLYGLPGRDWHFNVTGKGDGFLLQLVYYEPDSDHPGSLPVRQGTRKWYVSSHSTETEVVRTAYKCVLCSLEHRLGEHFRYQGSRVYGPHAAVGHLMALDCVEAQDVRPCALCGQKGQSPCHCGATPLTPR